MFDSHHTADCPWQWFFLLPRAPPYSAATKNERMLIPAHLYGVETGIERVPLSPLEGRKKIHCVL